MSSTASSTRPSFGLFYTTYRPYTADVAAVELQKQLNEAKESTPPPTCTQSVFVRESDLTSRFYRDVRSGRIGGGCKLDIKLLP